MLPGLLPLPESSPRQGASDRQNAPVSYPHLSCCPMELEMERLPMD